MTQRITKLADLRNILQGHRQKNQKIGLIPTMGYLHEGHLSLVQAAQKTCDVTLATVFVNPTQFGPNEDLAAYPREEEEDRQKLASIGTTYLFTPGVEEIYPDGFATTVRVEGLTEMLCGTARPGHFDGVALVVSKLLNIAQADQAFFGEKDYQQLLVIKQLAKDLNVSTEIIGVPIKRADDGLALSSRNKYLSDQERAIAPQLHATLQALCATLKSGEPAQSACAHAVQSLLQAGFGAVDYLEYRDATNLQQLHAYNHTRGRLFVAARLGRARLIDNIEVA